MPRHHAERTEDDRRRSTEELLIPAEIQVTQVDRGAAQQVFELDREIFGEGCWSHQQWVSEFASPGVIILLAVQAGQPCGFLSSGIAGDDLEIRKVGVLPRYRRHGLGRRLLQQATMNTANTARRCLIEVSSANAEGLAFYRRTGFTEIGQRTSYYADGSTAIVMEKILSVP
ncbi:MAG TPA: GNAT family N-acetyltransferase [Turneriella sp.]|nr:GNAT family N-acetyltransferase [Turneriella sp.]HNE18264.1 GNAT family N-acetyltransferase [Turneriella sp.]HNL53345.1 GNAT family N-acetyltransferase [Turneriella sp.]